MKCNSLWYYKKFFLLFFISLIWSQLHAGKYVIAPWPRGGIAMCLHSVINHIRLCEIKGQTPVVYWSTNSYYYIGEGFNGNNNNVWEYYFKPVSDLSYARGDRTHQHFPDSYWRFRYYLIDSERRHEAWSIIDKYIELKPEVQNKIDDFYETYMIGKKTIGIHMRGTDKYREEKKVEPAVMIAEALKYDAPDIQYLIATDDKKLFDGMMHFLTGKTVIYYDCYRSDNGQPLHANNCTIPNKPSRAQIGEDVLVEMWLLAKCDLFLHTASNVSSFVLYLNPDVKNILLK